MRALIDKGVAVCSYFTRLFDRFASVAIQASTCPYSTESVISFVASEYGCSKESVDTNY